MDGRNSLGELPPWRSLEEKDRELAKRDKAWKLVSIPLKK